MEIKKINKEINNVKDDNLKTLAQLFPSVIKDGKLDIEALKEELGEYEEVNKKEKYELTWSGKQRAKQNYQEDVHNKTLKYFENESKNADTTENIYIEGDNLEVLKLLRSNYYNSIKMIYIDPPYNTGNDFVYNDNFSMSKEQSDLAEGLVNEAGERLEKNQKTSNKYHANWLNMMYPRLKLARDLLTDDGVIFISIDDKEQANLKKICDEIFGGENLDILIWQKTDPWIDRNTNAKQVNRFLEFKEYIIVCYKNKFITNFNKIRKLPDWKNTQKNLDKDPRGNWQSGIFSYEEGHKNEDINSNSYFEIITPNGTKYKRHWYCENYEEYKKLESEEYLYFGKDGGNAPRIKIFENLEKDFYLNSILRGFGTSSSAKDEILEIFKNREIFDTPKPVKLLKELIRTSNGGNIYILDFFSGSATTAHSVMQLNAEDGGNRKYIMVQLPELTYTSKKQKYKDENGIEKEKDIIDKETNYPVVDKDSEARKAGYYTIAEIGKERIRRAGEKIKQEIEEYNNNLKLGEESKKIPDIGFKVFKVDKTNIKWNNIENIDISNIQLSSPDIIDFELGTNDIDVVYELMLRQRDVKLSETIEVLNNIGNRTYLYASSYLVCLETTITVEIIEKLAELDPLPTKFIFRDSAFKDDIALKDETFRRLEMLVKRNHEKNSIYGVEFI